jgi:ATP-dependent Clp protease ATP-binding subunit ClpA
MVESMAEAIHGHPDFMLKIHCAEYSEDHQIARIIGAPPGYIGHDTTEPVISLKSLTRGWTEKGPNISILLFDEIEKASPRLWQLLLGVMDKAEMVDGRNNRIDMSRCWIFMTSNIGTRAINQDHIGIVQNESKDSIANEAISAAKKNFDPEFMGRIDGVITFNKLSREHYDKILTMELELVWKRVLGTVATSLTGLPSNLFTMALTDKLNNWMIDQGTSEKHGARGLRRLVEEKILKSLATILTTNQIKKPGVVVFDLEPGDVISARYRQHEEGKIILTDIIEESLNPQPGTVITEPGKYVSDGEGHIEHLDTQADLGAQPTDIAP